MDDSILIKGYLSGDESALEELVVKYQKNIYRLAYNITGDIEESKDITQNTFLNVVRNLNKFRGESSFKTWLYRIAINLCFNHKKKHRYKDEELKETIVSNQSGSLGLLIKKDTEHHLNEALTEVPERQRLAILLRVHEGMNCQEAAKIMNISEGAVKANYHNGVKRLRELLKGYGYETGT